jgi:hypothetical protein
VGLAVIFTATAVCAPVLARDDGRHRTEHRRHDRGARVERTVRHVRHVVVPRRIRIREVRTYRPYYRGRVYDSRHRHSHTVYTFPVRTRFGVELRPHVYCGERLFRDGYVAYHGDRFGFVIGF